MLGHVLYWWLAVVGLLDLWLVLPAIRRTETGQVLGRLTATLCTLAGMVLVGSGRLMETVITLPLSVEVGMFLVDIGLTGYALFLPDRGLIQLVAHLRRGER